MTIADWMFEHPYMTFIIGCLLALAIGNIGNKK